ncbi:MAG: hypothetical protein DI528_05695 [Shinella sp.]|nr:MAG: hypothetical protein DI528_05695 [Shinella sp.]
MSKQRQQQRAKKRRRLQGQSATVSPAVVAAVPVRGTKDAVPVPAGTRPDFRRILRSSSFRWSISLLLFGFFFLLLSQTIPHDYGFMELGFLFTLSVYDIVLAMLGLAVACAMAPRAVDMRNIVLVFFGVLAGMLMFFDPIFQLIFSSPLGDYLFLVAPGAVMLTGASLWLSGVWRQWAVMLAAGIVAFSMSLFIGLDDLGIGIFDFTVGTVLCSLWLVVAPALPLRQFRGPWLTIPSRIVGSWLVVIGIIVLASLYVPLPMKAPALPDPTMPDGGKPVELLIPDDGSPPTLNGEELPLDLLAPDNGPANDNQPSQ